MCTEDESLSVDAYILLTEKRIIEILATSAEKVVSGVVDVCHLKRESTWKLLWLAVESPSCRSVLGGPFLSLSHK